MTLADAGNIAAAMQLCVKDRLIVVISGGTSTGKTTFARGLLALVEPLERIITIEDAFELFPEQQNSVALKADRASNGERTSAKLLEASLRMRLDRIILGELRGEESKNFLETINTGQGGSFTTVDAHTSRKAIDRLALIVMSTGINMSFDEVRRYCATSIDVVVQLGRESGRRGGGVFAGGRWVGIFAEQWPFVEVVRVATGKNRPSLQARGLDDYPISRRQVG